MNGMNRDAIVRRSSSVQSVRPSVQSRARMHSIVAHRSSRVARRSSTTRRVNARARVGRGRGAHDEPRVMTRHESHPSIPSPRASPPHASSPGSDSSHKNMKYIGIQYLQYVYVRDTTRRSLSDPEQCLVHA